MASWLQGLAGWVRRRPDSWAAEVAFRRAWNSMYRYRPPPGRRGMILPISSWSMGSWAPGPLAEGQLAWTAPGWIRGRLAAVVAGGGSCAASSAGRRCRSGGAGAGVAVLCRGWWLQFGFGQPFRVPSWSEEPHIGRQCGRVAPPHVTEVAFFGLLRHRTRVDVVEDVYLEFYRQLVFAELMLCWS